MPTTEERLSALEIDNATQKAQYGFIVDSLGKIEKALNNGIKADVQELMLWKEEHKAQSERKAANWRQIMFPVASQVIMTVITIFAVLAVLHIPPF